MEQRIDLHVHSNCSDGSMSPEELMRHAKASGLSAVALTDHDTVDGLARAKKEAEAIGLEFIPGIELSVVSDAETHIVGLYVDPEEPRFAAALEKIRRERRERNDATERALSAIGLPVSKAEAREEAGSDLIGRAHFAKVMVKKGFADSVKDAFDRFLGVGGPAYCPIRSLSAEEGIALINGAGGVAIAAHLHHMKKEGAALEAYLRELKGYGLAGAEAIYSEYTPEMSRRYGALIEKLGLLPSGGTDFHGTMKPHIAIGKGFGELSIPYSLLNAIKLLTKKGKNDKI